MESISAVNKELWLKFEERAKKALFIELPYGDRFPPLATPTQASVLLIFAQADTEISLLVTKRTESVLHHTGQMAFPGGRCEVGESSLEAAFRETEEEVGIQRGDLLVLGKLPPVHVPTGFLIEPYVALHKKSVSEVIIQVSADEIAETLWAPWSVLNSPETYRKEMISRGAIQLPTHVFYVGGHRVWGATAAMIKNFLDRCSLVG
jgi:8-oxo-dGTP pyrophosphatase MutT (NUDIX family)